MSSPMERGLKRPDGFDLTAMELREIQKIRMIRLLCRGYARLIG